MVTFKSNTQQAVWVALGSLSAFLMSIVSSMVLVRYMSKSDYGTYKQILYVYNSLLVLFSAGIPSAYAYFLPRFSIEKQKDVVKRFTIVLLILGFIFSCVLFFSSGLIATILKNEKLAYSLKVFSPIPMLLLPTLGIEGIYSTLKRTHYVAIYHTVSRMVLLFSILIPVVVFQGSYIDAVYGWLASSFVLLWFGLSLKGKPYKNVDTGDSGVKTKELLTYSIPLMLATLLGVGTRAADQFFISRYFGEEVFAVYATGKLQLPFVGMITNAVITVLAPLFSKLTVNLDDTTEIKELWTRSLMKSVKLIYPSVLFFVFFSVEIFEILYGKAYIESANFFCIYSMISFFQVVVFAPLILGLGLTKFYSRLHLFEFLMVWSLGIASMYLFRSPYSIIIIVSSVEILKILFGLRHIAKVLNTRYLDLLPIKKMGSYFLHGVLVLVVLRLLVNNLWPSELIIVQTVVCFIIYVLLLLLTSKIVKLDYLESIQPMLQRVPIVRDLTFLKSTNHKS
ncbi:hypothetical protein EYV94_08220 [Puteibacter caeruleilacunae]|nr:hypothetical protein EYV94_08220 [Puteibacter caeruleilacunae]